jgi:hypothetical protein
MLVRKRLNPEAREAARAALRAIIDAKYDGYANRWAAVHGFTSPYVSMVLNGLRPPSQRILDAMAMEAVPTAPGDLRNRK